MHIAIEIPTDTTWITDANGGARYPRDLVLSFGDGGLRLPVEMRDLILWTTLRLETGAGGKVLNHRAALTLRSIAERYYPHTADDLDDVVDDIRDELRVDEITPEQQDPVRFDDRLLDLQDGMVFVMTCIVGNVIGQHVAPSLARLAGKTIDFPFPSSAVDTHGVRGIRIPVKDLMCWLLERETRIAMAHVEPWVVLEELHTTHLRGRAASDLSRASRRKLMLNAGWLGLSYHYPRSPDTAAEQDEILKELSALL